MMFRRVDTASVRNPDDEGARKSSSRPVSNPADMIDDLIDAGIQKAFKLNLRNRTNPVNRHAERHRHDPQLRQRRVHHPAFAEFLLQTVGNTKDAAFFSHVFTEDHDPVIPFQFLPKREIDRFNHIELGHAYPPSERIHLPSDGSTLDYNVDFKYSSCSLKGGVISAKTYSKISFGSGAGIASASLTAWSTSFWASSVIRASASSDQRPLAFK
jgi:hypothetical protein